LIAQILRGQTVESSHLIDAVVVDSRGKVVESFGQISNPTFPRSAIKMIQALALLESGASDAFALSLKRISLACASHQGEEIHTSEVRDWLDKIGLSSSSFECGAHYPYDEQTKFKMIRENQKPSALHNNCSGKHCGMLTTALFLKENPAGYSKYDHPVQVRLRKILGELAGINYDLAPWGIDGCGIPTYAIPLEKMAVSMSALLAESDSSSVRKQAAQHILQAVTAEPEMISGTKGLCSKIIRISNGRSIAKTGAEGIYAGLIPAQGLAMALKVRDGATRAAELAAVHLLQKFKGLNESETSQVLPLTDAVLTNWSGTKIGEGLIIEK